MSRHNILNNALIKCSFIGGLKMKVCPTCGAQLEDTAQFCPNCGYNFGQAAPQGAPVQQFQQDPNYQQPQYQQPQAPVGYDPFDHTSEFDYQDVSENKLFAILMYFTAVIGIIIALLVNKDSAYLKFHIRQIIKLMIAEFLCVVLMIIPILGWIAAGICSLIITIIWIICLVKTCKGKSVEPAIVRNWNFLK